MTGLTAAATRLKWTAILAVVALPWAITHGLVAINIELPSDIVEKDRLFREGGAIDTIILGDSKVFRISQDAMRARGWKTFNLGTSLTSPEDEAMQLQYALDHASIRRVVMGLTFENMTERFPFEFSHGVHETPFQRPDIVAFAEITPGTAAAAPPLPRPRRDLAHFVLPAARATMTLHALLDRWGMLHVAGRLQPDGTTDYPNIQSQIARGVYDFAQNHDPRGWMQVEGSDDAYRRTGRLAPHAKALFQRIFASLRARGIPCVAFETGRWQAYQDAIDADPLLARLQSEWRAFFRGEVTGCARFLDNTALAGVYRQADFFDAVHFMGPTEQRLGVRLADELAQLDATCGARAAPAARTKEVK